VICAPIAAPLQWNGGHIFSSDKALLPIAHYEDGFMGAGHFQGDDTAVA
jgi:hypothetical protein